MVTQELIPRKEKLFVSCWLLWSFKKGAKVGPKNICTQNCAKIQLTVQCARIINPRKMIISFTCEDGVIQGCKSHTYSHTHIQTHKHTPPAIIAAISGSRTKLPFNNKITHFLSSSSRDKKSVRQYIGNEKWYWRWAGVKTTIFLKAFDIMEFTISGFLDLMAISREQEELL